MICRGTKPVVAPPKSRTTGQDFREENYGYQQSLLGRDVKEFRRRDEGIGVLKVGPTRHHGSWMPNRLA